MLKSSAPVIIVLAIVFLALEACKVQWRISFGWAGVTLLALYLLLSQVIP